MGQAAARDEAPGASHPASERSNARTLGAERLRICMIVPAHWDAVMGGSQYQAKMLVEHLLQTGAHEIVYLARHVPSAGAPEGYEIRQIASPAGIRRYGEVLDTFDLLALLKRISPDVIYQRVGCAYTGVAAYYARKARKRCVWHVACDQDVLPFDRSLTRNMPVRFLDKVLLEYGLRNADAVVTQTRQQAENLWRYYGRKAAATIPNYHPLPSGRIEKSGPIKVAWIANVKPLKQPEVFLRLAGELSGLEGVEFIMIGKPMGKREWWRDIVARADALPNLRFMGEQPQEAVNRVLAGAHVLVNTSAYEGFPNTFIQAWLHEVPVLSLLVNPDGVFTGRRIGLCAGSYEALKSDLLRLIRSSELRYRMGTEARKHAEKHHAERRNLDRLAAIITASASRGAA